MRKVKEVLRLRFELGLGQRQIARSCGMGLGTVTSIWNGRWQPGSVGRCRKAWAKKNWKPSCLATSPCRPQRCDSGHSRIGIPSISNCNNIVI